MQWIRIVRADLRWRRVANAALALGFLGLVAALLVRHIESVEWGDVVAAVGRYDAATLVLAAAIAAASHVLYGTYDVLARAAERHAVPVGRTWAIGAVSYAFNLNLGALVGGVGVRVRLYRRHGIEAAAAARVVALVVAGNWFGYLLAAGVALTIGAPRLPNGFAVDPAASRLLGVAFVVAACAALGLAALRGGRSVRIGRRCVPVPPFRIAALQVGVAATNWLAIGTLLWVLLGRDASWVAVVSVALVAAIAGVVSHVPAGLGVLEFVFVSSLGGLLGDAVLFAALLTYRALYYLAPLAVASFGWALLERTAGGSTFRRRRADGGVRGRAVL
jgi:uncharacterized membrane protein YbhN (UPF0104 family)